jgi:transposase
MSKYSKQFKLKVVKEFLKSGGLKRVAYLFKISHSQVRNWILAHRLHGIAGLNPKPVHHTAPFKMQVLQYIDLHQVSLHYAAAHFNIPSPSTVWMWQKLYNEGGIAALQSKPKGRPPMPKQSEIAALLARPSSELTHEELLRKAQYLEVENAYLKKLEALAQQKHLASKNKSK